LKDDRDQLASPGARKASNQPTIEKAAGLRDEKSTASEAQRMKVAGGIATRSKRLNVTRARQRGRQG